MACGSFARRLCGVAVAAALALVAARIVLHRALVAERQRQTLYRLVIIEWGLEALIERHGGLPLSASEWTPLVSSCGAADGMLPAILTSAGNMAEGCDGFGRPLLVRGFLCRGAIPRSLEDEISVLSAFPCEEVDCWCHEFEVASLGADGIEDPEGADFSRLVTAAEPERDIVMAFRDGRLQITEVENRHYRGEGLAARLLSGTGPPGGGGAGVR